ncbi:zinc finger B-box domain-containing protein 1 isoform X2 [Poecilia formosa]|uniref:zinc finger B-box domain-containing protein 1 isoform X2 n=1 Tax=Poecilia formosa TaxID=48698 RepID=UPI0007BA86E2|nr:PREDICTED: zinc finger B-box domain-containing protein 1 isoform X2 [Poecilia formosa]
MNLNDYVVPNNKTRSVKLNARNLHKLQLDTTTLASESKKMEEKLKQLKENMSKEKEERRHFRDLRWKFGQCISSISNPQPNSFKKINDNKIQKLPAGKIKIRVLKDEPLPAPPQSSSSSSIPNAGLGMTKRTRVKGTISRKCEVKSTKLTDAQAQVISQDVSYFQRKINPGSFPGIYNPDSSRSPDSNHSLTFNAITTREDEWPKNGTKVLVVKHGQEKAVGVIEDDKSELANSIFTGQYSEEESARSFQEALIQWRKERSEGKESLVTTDVLETSTTPALVSATSTQTDISPGREADGLEREGAEGKLRVKFSENSLTYMDKLLLKKHRRTPVESPPSLAFDMGLKSPATTDIEEEMATILTAEEEDFREYCSSLLKVPASKDSTESQVSTPELYLVIEILDEESKDKKMVSPTEQKLDSNPVSSKADLSSTRSTQPSRPSKASVRQKVKKSRCLHDQISKNDSVKEDDSCAEKARIHGHLPMEKSREMANNLEMSYREDLRQTEKDLQTEGTRQRPETHMVMQNQTAGFGSEQFCDLDGFLPLGLDTDTGHPDSPEQTHCDRLHTCQFSVRASDPTGHRSHSSLGRHSEEYLLCEVMKDRYAEPTGIQIHPTQREEMSPNELRTSGGQLPRAPQVIMEICSVDQTGCEDPDMDTDMTARMLHIMEQELQLLANTQCMPVQVFSLESEDSGGENGDESQHLKWDGPSREQHQEENTTERDQQSVLFLP